MHRRSMRTIAATLTSVSLTLSMMGTALAVDPSDLSATPLSPTDRVTGSKAPSSSLAQTDPQLLARDDAAPIQVMIKLDYDAIAAYQGGVAGLAATSPSVTGQQLSGDSAAEQNYEAYIASRERAFIAQLQSSVPSAVVSRSFRIVYGGVSATIPANAVEAILEIDGAVAVHFNALKQPLTDSSPEFVGAPAAYDALGTTANAGAGVIYGNLDTDIWPEHPSFADLGNLAALPPPARECNYGDNPLTPEADVFVCQNKLIGGAHFTDDYDAALGDDPYGGTARDGDGHGTHTSSTSAGNIVEDVEVLGVNRGTIHGLAPGAWVMEYKVCGPQGCFDSDSAAAVAQAILDGVDVINFSISGGTQPFTDPVELAFLDAYAAGVFVSASAGNEGPGASTANHLSPWVTTVAASTQTREFASTLTLNAGGDTFAADGASITASAGPLPVVLAADVPGYGDPLCGTEPPSPTIFDGFIVGCERGTQARVWKGFVVHSGGGEGMVLYNPALADNETDNHWLPTIHLADGTDFVAFMESHSDVTGSFTAGEARDGQGDVMAAFSSRGPAGNFIKPDVTAPGVQILAGASPTPPTPTPDGGGSPPGEYYQAIAGTSMSSPHVAGAGLLVRAVHPTWTPGQIKSALMTTALTDVLKEDLATPADPFDFGGGRIEVGAANGAGLSFDETADRYFAMANNPVLAVHLNVPSINAQILPGRLVTTRVATNVGAERARFDVNASVPAGSSIIVSPDRFTLQPGESATLTITIQSDAPIGVQQFGSININSRGSAQHLPVAFIHTQGSVNLSQSCDDESIRRGEGTQCDVVATNNSFDEQTVDLDTFTNANLKIVDTIGAGLVGGRATLHNQVLAGAQPGVPSVDPGELFGYIPLDAYGVDPIAVGDEEIVNFDAPAFQYTGQTFTSFGVDSNGYIIVGGGTAEDNNCCSLPAGPDPERPNNVLAPFWTDLDGTAAPGIFVATLGLPSGEAWIVVEFRLDVWGTTDERVFQTWIGINGEEDITYAYAAPQADPNGQDFLVGAENVIGQGDMEAVLPTADLRVSSSDPVPGDSVSYSVFVEGVKRGTGVVTSEMTTDGVPGVTVVNTEIAVTR